MTDIGLSIGNDLLCYIDRYFKHKMFLVVLPNNIMAVLKNGLPTKDFFKYSFVKLNRYIPTHDGHNCQL